MHYRLQRQRSGALAVHNTAYAETMHPGAGPWAEATRLYVQGSGLPAALSVPASRGGGPLVLFDVGLGAAANALAAVACHDDLLRRGKRPRPLRIVSFEADPEALRFAIAQADALGYPRGHEALLGELLAAGRAQREGGLTWELRLGDFPRLIREEPARADLVFFDPFSPHANPLMWSLATLEALYHCRRRAGRLRLVTYSTAFGTRAGLLLAGFYVGEGPRPAAGGAPGKGPGGPPRAGTVAATWFADLERPLAPAWLARWRHDREPWPPGTPAAAHRALRERLGEHPQWAQFPAEPVPRQAPQGPPPRPAPRPERSPRRRGSSAPSGAPGRLGGPGRRKRPGGPRRPGRPAAPGARRRRR
jgi:S-adenosyl-L-methionine-dependent methyltransferase